MRALWAIKPLRLLVVQVLLVDIGQVAVEIATRKPVCHGEVLVKVVTALLGSGAGDIASKPATNSNSSRTSGKISSLVSSPKTTR